MATEKRHAPAGWYADPKCADQLRYWNGSAWTKHVAPAVTEAAAGTDPAPAEHYGPFGLMID
ncbi:MAG: DUF2510 domain-containing protein [Acidimicrobiales bacterium]|jgi:hypothetical protein